MLLFFLVAFFYVVYGVDSVPLLLGGVLALKKADYAQRALYLDGKPLSFEAVPFMRWMINCGAEKKVFQTGRQIGKSTSISAEICTEQTAIPYYRSLYVAPRNEQVMQFSKDRLSSMITYSPHIRELFVNAAVQQQVKAKEFTNGSMVFLRSCYHTADGIRGISSNSVYIDEIQDIILDNIPVIEETTARKNPRKIVYCGTPKTFDNPIAKIWAKSSECYWAVKCEACGHWNVPLDLANILPEFLCCARCQRQIFAWKGKYVAKYADRPIVGFHVSQLMIYGVPGTGLPWSRITEKLNDPLYGMAKFNNECLGFSYDSGAKLLTESVIRAVCHSEYKEFTLDRNPDWNMWTVCGGVDWGVLGGNTHTVVTIGGLDSSGKLRLMYAKRFPVDEDPFDQVERVAGIFNQAGCAIICADRGGGHHANSHLKKKLSAWTKMYEIEYKAKFLEGMKYNNKSKSWITDRTRAVAGIVIDIKSGNVIFPSWETMQPFVPDLLTLSCEYNDRIRAYQILRQEEIPDDFAHSFTYLRLAAKKICAKPAAQQYDLEEFMAPVTDDGEDVE